MSSLLERIAKCSRDDDPSEIDRRPSKPPKWTPTWVQRAREGRLPAKELAS